MTESATSFTIEDLLNLIARSGLLNDRLLEAQRQRFLNSEIKPKAAINQMLAENLLTSFQSRQLSERRHRGFFLSEKYKILEFLGQGGMSRVLLCEHLLLQRLVAVKILNKSLDKFPGAAERFLREARASASMDHPNIARVFDVDRTGLGPCIVMEYVDGTNLHELAHHRGLLDVKRVANFMSQAATGLQHAHEAGLVHRDIKPANLMLDRSGTIKLLDLGLARFFDPTRSDNLTQQIDASSIIGTADYIAPEQVMESSSADIRADIYSLGYTMYFLLTRILPAGTGPAMRKLLWHQTREPDPVRCHRPEVPEAMAAVLEKMIKKRPEDRYQTPAEVVAALAEWTSMPLPPPPDDEMPRTKPGSYRLGLCPPPDHSKFEAATTKPVAKEADPSQSKPVPTTDVNQSAPAMETATAAAPPESTVGYTNTKDVESFAAEDVKHHSADTNVVTSAALETTSTAMSSLVRSLPDPAKIINPRYHTSLLILISIVFSFGTGIWFSQIWMSGRSKDSSQASASNRDAAVNGLAAPRLHQDNSNARGAVAVVLRGGGSTFIHPVMETWIASYEKTTGVKIEYSAVGSTRGIEGLMANFLDFSCTEVALTDEQLADAGFELVHVPLALGAVVAAYNVSDAKGEPLSLRFTSAILTNIYLGKIKNWNDPAIALSNPGRELPDLPITVIYRKDGSGTTAILTEYLSKTNATWKSQLGMGTKIAWPVGVGTDKSHGIADAVNRTAGSIGYVELSYAIANGLSVSPIMNQSGNYIAPTVEGITAATSSLRAIPPDLRFSVVDASGANAYPIVGISWAVLRKEQLSQRGGALVEFFKWVTTEGQSYLAGQQYGRLPPELADRITQSLNKIMINN